MIKPGLILQTQLMFDFFNNECKDLEYQKDNGLEIDKVEYNKMKFLREKSIEVGFDLNTIEESNKFSSELANLTC